MDDNNMNIHIVAASCAYNHPKETLHAYAQPRSPATSDCLHEQQILDSSVDVELSAQTSSTLEVLKRAMGIEPPSSHDRDQQATDTATELAEASSVTHTSTLVSFPSVNPDDPSFNRSGYTSNSRYPLTLQSKMTETSSTQRDLEESHLRGVCQGPDDTTPPPPPPQSFENLSNASNLNTTQKECLQNCEADTPLSPLPIGTIVADSYTIQAINRVQKNFVEYIAENQRHCFYTLVAIRNPDIFPAAIHKTKFWNSKATHDSLDLVVAAYEEQEASSVGLSQSIKKAANPHQKYIIKLIKKHQRADTYLLTFFHDNMIWIVQRPPPDYQRNVKTMSEISQQIESSHSKDSGSDRVESTLSVAAENNAATHNKPVTAAPSEWTKPDMKDTQQNEPPEEEESEVCEMPCQDQITAQINQYLNVIAYQSKIRGQERKIERYQKELARRKEQISQLQQQCSDLQELCSMWGELNATNSSAPPYKAGKLMEAYRSLRETASVRSTE